MKLNRVTERGWVAPEWGGAGRRAARCGGVVRLIGAGWRGSGVDGVGGVGRSARGRGSLALHSAHVGLEEEGLGRFGSCQRSSTLNNNVRRHACTLRRYTIYSTFEVTV